MGAVDRHASGGNDGRWGGCGGSGGGGAGDGVRCGGGLRARPRRSCGAASVEPRVRCSWVLYTRGCRGGAPSIEVAPQDESALVCTATLRLVRFARRCACGASGVPSPGEDSGGRGWQEGTLSTRQRAGRTGARASSSHCAVVATRGSAAGSGGRHGTAMVVGQWRVPPPAHAHVGRAHTGWCCRIVGVSGLVGTRACGGMGQGTADRVREISTLCWFVAALVDAGERRASAAFNPPNAALSLYTLLFPHSFGTTLCSSFCSYPLPFQSFGSAWCRSCPPPPRLSRSPPLHHGL